MRWKVALQAVDITFDGRLTAGRRWTKPTEFHRSPNRPAPSVAEKPESLAPA